MLLTYNDTTFAWEIERELLVIVWLSLNLTKTSVDWNKQKYTSHYFKKYQLLSGNDKIEAIQLKITFPKGSKKTFKFNNQVFYNNVFMVYSPFILQFENNY